MFQAAFSYDYVEVLKQMYHSKIILPANKCFKQPLVTIMFKYLKQMYHTIIILPAIKCFKQPLVTIMLKY